MCNLLLVYFYLSIVVVIRLLSRIKGPARHIIHSAFLTMKRRGRLLAIGWQIGAAAY